MADLLSRLATPDLTALAVTVTSRLVAPRDAGEAVAAIIQHTERPQDLLKRRRIKKELLFKYLHDQRVDNVTATADKFSLVSSVLTLWESANTSVHSDSLEENSLPEAPAPSRNASYTSLCSLDLGGKLSERLTDLAKQNAAANGSGQHVSSSLPNPPFKRAHSSSSSNLVSVQDDGASMQ